MRPVSDREWLLMLCLLTAMLSLAVDVSTRHAMEVLRLQIAYEKGYSDAKAGHPLTLPIEP